MSANNESDNDTNGTEKIHSQNMETNIQDMSLILAELIKRIKRKPLSEEGDMSLLLAELIKTIEKKPPSEEEENAEMFLTIATLQPETYDGTLDPVILENWLRGMEKQFDIVDCPAHRKVGYDVYYLKGQADLWWSTLKKVAEAPEFGWEEFKDLMRKKFFPPFLRRQKEREFIDFTQGKMSVVNYAFKFLQLSRFAPHVVDIEERKMEKFLGGLRWPLRCCLLIHSCTSYDELFDRALNVERVLREIDKEKGYKRKLDHGSIEYDKSQFKRQTFGSSCEPSARQMTKCRVGMKQFLLCGSSNYTKRICPRKAHIRGESWSSSSANNDDSNNDDYNDNHNYGNHNNSSSVSSME